MPVQACTLAGRPGFKWGQGGRCYTYTPGDERGRDAAKQLAFKQGLAIDAKLKAEGKPTEIK